MSNRRGWEEALGREIARSRRDGTPLYVALFDLDDFKRYNDEHGHQAGDDLLRQTASEWSSRLRATDILARYGGEEFALVFPTHPPETAVWWWSGCGRRWPPGSPARRAWPAGTGWRAPRSWSGAPTRPVRGKARRARLPRQAEG